MTLEDSNNLPYSWTPDSKSVIFVSDRTGNMLPYKQALDQTVAEPIITDGGNNSMPSPSPDGQWILYVLDGGDAQKVMRVPLFGGPAQLIFKAKTGFDLHCPRVPATQCVMATGSEDGQLTFALLNAGDGGSRILYRYSTTYANGDFGGWAVSPDGSEIAVMSSDYQKAEIDVLSLSGQLKQKIGVRGWNRLGGLDYSSDGKSFYTGYLGLSGATLLRVNRAGNAEPLWRRPGTNMGTYAIQSPDGHYLAFMANSSAENAWMIDGI